MHKERKDFSFAGTKDKRGITVQKVRHYRLPEKQIYGANTQLQNITLGNCM